MDRMTAADGIHALGSILMRFISPIFAFGLLFAGSAGAAPTPALAPAGSIQGLWQVEDGSAVIELLPCGEEWCGRIFWSHDLATAPPGEVRDDANPNPSLRHRSLCDLEIIRGLKMEAVNFFGGGTVYNPDDGLTYGAEMRLENNGTLRFRGFLALPILGGSQIWRRPDRTPDHCPAPAAEQNRAAGLAVDLKQTPR